MTVPARGTAPILLGAVAGEQVTLRLDHADTVAGDNAAWVSVPPAAGPPTKTVVTLVGQPSRALALARAFAAVPGHRAATADAVEIPSSGRALERSRDPRRLAAKGRPAAVAERSAGSPPARSRRPRRRNARRHGPRRHRPDESHCSPASISLRWRSTAALPAPCSFRHGSFRSPGAPLVRCSPPATTAGSESRSWRSTRLTRTCSSSPRFRCSPATSSAGRLDGRRRPRPPASRSP